MENENLKPCPFCGSEDITEHSSYPMNFWSIKCMDCGGRIMVSGSRQQAITAWNRRAHHEI